MLITNLRHLFYFVREGAHHLLSGGISIWVSIISIACSIFLLCLYTLVSHHLFPFLREAQNIPLAVYLKDEISSQQLQLLEQKITHLAEVSKIRFISKEEALADFRQSLGQETTVIDGLTENPLPASFELSIVSERISPTRLPSFIDEIRHFEGVEDIQGGGAWMQRFYGLIMVVRVVFIVLGFILTLISLFIIAGTIHLTIEKRKEEIAIMRLVGATEGYLRWPFFLEGIFEGFLGTALAIMLFFIAYSWFIWKMGPFVPYAFGISSFSFLSYQEIGFIFLVGSLMGGGGSWLSFFLQKSKSD